MQSKEKDWEVHIKEVDKLQSKVSDLEYSLNLKQSNIDNLEKKLTMCSNAKIESLFKCKVTNNRKQSEEYYILKEIWSKKIFGDNWIVMYIIELRWPLLRGFAFHVRNDYSYCKSCRENC